MKQNIVNFSTGTRCAGTIFSPFSDQTPSDMSSIGSSMNSASVRRAPIASGGSGWTSKPDAGGTSLSRNSTPIGEPWVLFLLALLFAVWRGSRRKRALAAVLLCATGLQAGISSLSIRPAAAGQTVSVLPTVASLPDGMVSICWSAYYDAEAENAIEDIRFQADAETGLNAVRFTAPSAPGTYYLKALMQTGRFCGGSMDSYVICPFTVYPADADIVLRRDAQESGTRIDIRDGGAMQAYGAMRFHRTTLNDDNLSEYERYNYFISFPFDVQVADIYGIGEVGTHWRIFFYDGKGRAEEGYFAERTDNWVMIDDTDSILHAGQGYLLQLNALQMAETNETIWSNHTDVATLYFPALSKITGVTLTNETIPALSEAYQCTIDLSSSLGNEADRRTKDSYWRCIGVPGFDAPTSISGLPYLYEWNMSDNSLKVVSCEAYTFLPTHAYLVQNGGEIVWTNISKPVRGIVAQHQNRHREFRLELLQDDKTADHTYVRLTENEQVTNAFDFGQDLSKELNAGQPNIYTLIGYERLAANCLPDSSKSVRIPVGVEIPVDGTYTFALPDGNQDRQVVLSDTQTGTRTHLTSDNSYSVTLPAGTHDDRFVLDISEPSSTPTALIPLAAPDLPTKILQNGQIFILRGDKIYTLTGQEVK